MVEGIRRGDSAAVRLMVERFEVSARRFAGRTLGDDLGEDAVQETFMEALRLIGDLKDPQAFPGWFRQILRTQVGRIARRRVPAHTGPAGEPACDDPPEAAMVREELQGQVREALAKLPSAGRTTAELFYLDGWSVAEIAAALQVPPGTIKCRLHDARRRLKEAMSSNW
jgi:RNA polymerase sigma-70 factor (ECF subfamily)